MNRPGDFEQVLSECQHGGRMFAAAVRNKIIFEKFGTEDRERCRRDHKAFCGCWVYLPSGEKLELWLCEDKFGETFASDDIEKAKPFPRIVTKAIKEEVAKFCREVEKDFTAKVLNAGVDDD
jgi:hypothetical protein